MTRVLLCGFLLAYEPYKRRDGELTAWVLTIHPVARFLVEIIRVDEAKNVFHTGMTISQTISVAIFVGGIALWILFARTAAASEGVARRFGRGDVDRTAATCRSARYGLNASTNSEWSGRLSRRSRSAHWPCWNVQTCTLTKPCSSSNRGSEWRLYIQ